jgi:two-component system response regulator PilR (NtrC family)
MGESAHPDERVRVLVVDDERGLREVLEITLRRAGLQVTVASSQKSALAAIEGATEPFPLILTDLVMPDGSGIDVLRAALARSVETQVIVITAHSTVEAAIEAMRAGAYDFVAKPFSPAEIAALAHKAIEKSTLVAENARLRAELDHRRPGEDPTAALGPSPCMRRVAILAAKAAATRSTVLITGESGTGKELLARLLHQLSDRASGPFCVVNCGALPEALMESELFGHEKGAFTGASSAGRGMFREADGGTILLDEVGELPAPLQVKLLRVLQDRKVRPVGATVEIPIDVRLLAATNRDVEQDVEQGRFRTDLYYRLNVIRIELPPLRVREGEARRLALRMVPQIAREMGKDVRGLTPEALRAIDAYRFPGNVRELENMVERAVALTASALIGLEDLPEEVTGLPPGLLRSPSDLPAAGCSLDQVLERTERSLIAQALARTSGVRTAAAKLLGISFRSFRYRLAKLGVEPEGGAEDDGPPSSESSAADPRGPLT